MAKRLPLIILAWIATDLYFFQAIHTLSDAATWFWLYLSIDLLLMIATAAMLYYQGQTFLPPAAGDHMVSRPARSI